MESELISIIVPIYNTSQYLEKCLNSIEIQTYSNIEVLLIDDGSTDLSGEIADEFAVEDKRFQVIHLENGGVSRARNKGLDMAQGKYVTFVDSDDYILENHIENLVRNFDDGVSLSICNYLIDENRIIKNGIKNKRSGKIKKDDLLEELAHIYGGFSFNKMFDLQFIKQHELCFDELLKMCEDLEFVLRYILLSKGEIFYSDLATYGYVQREDSASNFCDIEIAKTYFKAMDRCNQMLENISFNRLIVWKQHLVMGFYSIKARFIANGVDIQELEDIYQKKIFHIYEEVYANCTVKQKLKLYMQKEHMDLFIRLKNIKNKLKKGVKMRR